MRIWVLDTESDGLLDTISKFHVFVFKEYKKDNWKVFCNKEELPEWFIEQTDLDISPEWLNLHELGDFLLEDAEALACHNILGFDLRAWKLLEYIDEYTVGKDTITVAGQTKEIRIFDTLVMSRSLNPDRMLPFGCPTKKYNEVTEKFDTVGAHGLDSWGYRVSNAKPKVDDWRDQPLHVYVNRCIEDVKINELTLTDLIKESKDKAVNSKQQKGDWAVPLRLATKDYYLMVMQEETGCPFDSEAAEELIIRIDGMMKEIEEDVEPQLPLRDIPKSKRPNFPAKPFTDSGEISAHGWNWLVRLGYPVDKEVLEFKAPPKTAFKGDGDISKAGERYCINNGVEDPEQMPQYLRECKRKSSCKPLPDDLMDKAIQSLRDKEEPCMKEPMSISNQADIKDYLVFQEGWKPLHWRTKDITRDDNKRNVKDVVLLEKAKEYIDSVKESPYKEFIYEEYNLNFDKAPYEKVLEFVKNKGRYLITSPQLKDDRGNLCENLDRLKGDLAKQIVKWLSLRNRRSVIKAMDETKDTGWLNNDRIPIDGRLSGAHSGLTNTHRKKHRVISNLPKADAKVLLGKEMRSLFYAPEGWLMMGYDAQALENRVAAMYAYPFDGGQYATDVLDGDSHTKNAEAYSLAAGRTVSRDEGKGVTYGIMYGAQAAKVAKMLDIDRKAGQRVIDAFWDTNLGLGKLKLALEKYWESTGKQYIMGLDGRKIYTRSKHSLLNALFQSAGAIIMDTAGAFMYEWLKQKDLLEDAQRVIYYHKALWLYVAIYIENSFNCWKAKH